MFLCTQIKRALNYILFHNTEVFYIQKLGQFINMDISRTGLKSVCYVMIAVNCKQI